jgi:hypothetical protein
MIRTTADASSTSFEDLAVAISTGAIEANQILRGWIKFLGPLLAGQSLQISYCLAPPLSEITTAGQL